MPARNPEDCDQLFAEYARAGDIDAIVGLYEPDAVFIQNREPVQGTDAIRKALEGVATAKPRFKMDVRVVRAAGGELAVCYNDWRMTGPGPDGKPTEVTGKALEIVRRQPDGSWRILFDDPSGRG